MILIQTKLKVADNSGAKMVKCLCVYGGFKRRYARIGDTIKVVIKEAAPHAPVKDGDMMKAVIVRVRKEIKRADGTCLRFDDNACVLVDDKGEPKGSRIFGPIAREVRKRGFVKIASLAPEVL